MYSNDDLERFYFQYQTEAVPSGESVQSFCKRNNVPYNIFCKRPILPKVFENVKSTFVLVD